MSEEVLRLGERIHAVPVIHQRCAFAAEVRRRFLERRYAAVAVELPPFLLEPVIEAAARLPLVSAVVYGWMEGGDRRRAYVPVEPCEAVMEAIRLAVPERVPVHAVDLDDPAFENRTAVLPDEYAVRRTSLEAYYEAVRPVLPPTRPGSTDHRREQAMAAALRRLDAEADGPVLFVCGMAHLEGIRRAFHDPPAEEPRGRGDTEIDVSLYSVDPDTLYFFMGELPYTAFLYEKARASVDGAVYEETDAVKELLLAAARGYRSERPGSEAFITPQRLQLLLTWLRNLCLVQGRMTPYLYEFVTAAKGVCGSGFAVKVVETAKFYPFLDFDSPYPEVAVGLGEMRVRERGGRMAVSNRLPGPPVTWRKVRLKRPPLRREKLRWTYLWNPFRACSWPPEDEKIESFHRHVRGMTRRLLTEDQARVERFTTSVKDGIDLRETLRNWHRGEIYVKELPPARGEVEVVVFVFDDTEDWDRYPWRTTWYAEHDEESTLALYGTNFMEDLVGPGIGRAEYGGCFMLYPPRPVPDIWTDPRFDRCRSPAERLTVAALFHSRERFVTYVGPRRPGLRLRRAARRLGRHLVYIPLSSFSRETVRRLRVVHVLNGREIRSWASLFIRDPWRQ